MNNDKNASNRRNQLAATNEDTCGPYFPIYFEDERLADLTKLHHGLVVEPKGERIILRGRVLDRHGLLANGVVMEFWQANAKGVYRNPEHADDPHLDPWFDGFGRIRTASGAYSFKTIMPGSVAGRAPHITITLFSDGINRIVTQVFFDEQTANEGDPLLQSLADDDVPRLIAKYDGQAADGTKVYVFDIIMAGDNETPFFDDLES